MITVIASGFDRADQPTSYRPTTSILSRNNPPIGSVREPVRPAPAAAASYNRQEEPVSARRQPEMPQFLFGDPEQPKAAAPTRTYPSPENRGQEGYLNAGQQGAPSAAPYAPPSGYSQQGFSNSPSYPQPAPYAPVPAPYAPAPAPYSPAPSPFPGSAPYSQPAAPYAPATGYPQQGTGRPAQNVAPSPRSGRPPVSGQEPRQPEKKNRILPWFLTDNENLDE